MADCIIAGGAESMSIPMGGYKPVPESHYAKSNPDYYWEWVILQKKLLSNIKLQEKNKTNLLFESHQKALKAIAGRKICKQIVPIPVEYNF